MRNYLFIITLVMSFCTLFGQSQMTKSQKVPKKDRIDLAMSQELLMTKDPSLDKIPKSRLLEANKYTESLKDNISFRSATDLTWEERGPNNVGGRTRAIIFDANDASGQTVFAAGVSGGLWKTTSIEASDPQWSCVNDFFGSLAIAAIAQDPTNSSTMYFATGEGYFESDSSPGLGVWKSINGGNSWTHLNSTNNSNFDFTQSLVVTSTGTILAATKTGLHKSINGGSTWSLVLNSSMGASGDHVNDIAIASDNSWYVTIGIYNQDGIYKSTNQGASWTKLINGLPSTDYARIEIDVAPSDDNTLYALYEEASTHACLGIYKTVDGGATWIAMDNPAAYGMNNFARTQAWYNLSVAIDPLDANHVYIGGIDLLVTHNGGNSWLQLTQWNGDNNLPYLHADQHYLMFDPSDNKRLLVGNDGGVHFSANADQVTPSFVEKNKGYNITQFYATAVHPSMGVDYFLAGAQDNGTQIFDQVGENATSEATGGDGARCYIDQDNPSIQISSYVYNNYFVSVDNGASFNYVQLNNYGLFANASDYDSGNNILYASSSDGNILRWKNPHTLTTSFQHLIVSAMSGQKASFVHMSPTIDNRIYIGTADGELLYVDGANSGFFKNGTTLMNGTGFVSGISVSPLDENHIVITYSNYGVASIYETLDGGVTWNDVEGNLPDMPVRSVIINPNNNNEIIIGTELGVWRTESTDGVNTVWSPQNIGLANVRTDHLVYRESDKLLVAATHGRGLFTTSSLAGVVVPITLMDFQLSYGGDYVDLNWSYDNAKDMEAFYLEKSFDGEAWDEMGRVLVAAERNDLSYQDKDLFVRGEDYYYRLRLQDIDGSFTYSPVRTIYVPEIKPAFLFKVVPNPFDSQVSLHTAVDAREIHLLHFCNVNGEILMTLEGEDLVKSNEIDLEGYAPGVYFISYQTRNGKRGIQRLIKQSSED